MLTWETTVEAQALYARGWTKSAIARHLGINRRTVREYLKGQQVPGQRVRSEPEVFAPFAEYARLRLADDPHLWASTLFDELTALGYAGSYPSFTRALRTRKLRPHCEPCAASRGRDAGLIAHPPGAETQWDWLELPDPPAAWGWSASAHLLVGVLAHSSRWRAVLAEAEDQPQLIEAIDGVIRRLGGVSHRWRFDRMSTVCYPGSGRLTASFAPVAIHYGAGVDICPGAVVDRHRRERRGQPPGAGIADGAHPVEPPAMAHPAEAADDPVDGLDQLGLVLGLGQHRPPPRRVRQHPHQQMRA